MKINAFHITFFILLFFGATVGYFLGDWALGTADLATPDDIIKCRLGYPAGGICTIFYPAILIADWVERVFN